MRDHMRNTFLLALAMFVPALGNHVSAQGDVGTNPLIGAPAPHAAPKPTVEAPADGSVSASTVLLDIPAGGVTLNPATLTSGPGRRAGPAPSEGPRIAVATRTTPAGALELELTGAAEGWVAIFAAPSEREPAVLLTLAPLPQGGTTTVTLLSAEDLETLTAAGLDGLHVTLVSTRAQPLPTGARSHSRGTAARRPVAEHAGRR